MSLAQPSIEPYPSPTPASSLPAVWRRVARPLRRPALLLLLFLGILGFVYKLAPILPTRTIIRSEDGVSDFCFSPDGSKLAVATTGIANFGHVQIVDVSNGVKLISIDNASWQRSYPFSPDGRHLAVVNDTGNLRIMTADKDIEVASIDLSPFAGFCTFHFLLDGRLLAYEASPSNIVAFWDIKRGRRIATIDSHFGAFGRTVATSILDDGTAEIVVWSVSADEAPSVKGKFVVSGIEPRLDVPIAISPDLRTVAALSPAASDQRYVALWDIDSGTRRAEIKLMDDQGAGHYLSFAAGGRILTFTKKISAQMETPWITMAYDVIGEPRLIGSYNSQVNVAPDGEHLITNLKDGVELIDTSTGLATPLTRSGDYSFHPKYLLEAKFSPNSQMVAVPMNLAPHRPFFANCIPARVYTFPSAAIPGVRLWDVESGRELFAFENCTKFQFSPDNKCIATDGPDNAIRLWGLPLQKPTWLILQWSALAWLAVVAALQAFGLTWDRKAKSVEKVPA